jgi:small-conductance mechanosensitive channel
LAPTSSPEILDESSILFPSPIDPRSPRPAKPAPHEAPSAEELVSAAIRRLDAALEALDRAVSLQAERRMQMADQEAEYSAMQEDRSRLARALDAANGRVETLRENQVEAARRVERANAALRAILAASPEGA